MRLLFRTSRWLHKYVGLLLIVFAIWMSASGILMNHPDWIAGVSVPNWLVPPQYRMENWRRGALRCAVFSEHEHDTGFIAGSQGVWKTSNGGETFQSFNVGLPESPYYRRTNSIALCENGTDRLYAATRGGLYVCTLDTEGWRRIPLDSSNREHDEEVLKLVRVSDDLFAFTQSRAYRASISGSSPAFAGVSLTRATDNEPPVFLVKLFFDLHSGKVWGLPGRLLFDAAGLVIIFLGVSAFYVWYFPWKLKRSLRTPAAGKAAPKSGVYRALFKYHLKVGIWAAAILLVIGGTGVFMRPPLLAVLGLGTVPRGAYPGPLPDNPWHDRIRSALYDHVEDRIIIEATDGFWAGPPDLKSPFHKIDFPAPVFVMGTTVFEPYGDNGFLVGSFSGLFHLERTTGRSFDMRTNLPVRDFFKFKPAEVMAAGYMRTPDGREYLAAHDQGLIPLGDTRDDGRFQMPFEIAGEYEMPLWNFLFELHNGRIFRDIIGKWYALLVPLGSILFVLMTLTGVYDWCFLRFSRNAAPRRTET